MTTTTPQKTKTPYNLVPLIATTIKANLIWINHENPQNYFYVL